MVVVRDLPPFVALPVPSGALDPVQMHWNARQWQMVAQSLQRMNARLEFIIEHFSFAGHGGMLFTAPVAVANITNTWQRMKGWQVALTSEYVISDLPNGTIDILVAGAWALNFNITIDHNSLNQGRNLYMRMVSAVTGVQLGLNTTEIAIPRDTPETRFTGLVLFDFTGANGADPVALEIRAADGDTLSNVIYVQGNWSVFNVGPWRGELPNGGAGLKR